MQRPGIRGRAPCLHTDNRLVTSHAAALSLMQRLKVEACVGSRIAKQPFGGQAELLHCRKQLLNGLSNLDLLARAYTVSSSIVLTSCCPEAKEWERPREFGRGPTSRLGLLAGVV